MFPVAESAAKMVYKEPLSLYYWLIKINFYDCFHFRNTDRGECHTGMRPCRTKADSYVVIYHKP